VSFQLHAPAALLPWNDPLYPFNLSMGGSRPGQDVFGTRKISCFWLRSNPVPTALPRLPLRQRVYHSPWSFIATDRSLTALLLGMYLANGFAGRHVEGLWIQLHVFQTRYVMEMSGQHCGSGRTRMWRRTNYLPLRYIKPPLSFCNYMSTYSGSSPCLRLAKSEVSIAMKINIAVFWGRGVVKVTNVSEIPSASIFRVEDELAGSSTNVFTVSYFTLRP